MISTKFILDYLRASHPEDASNPGSYAGIAKKLLGDYVNASSMAVLIVDMENTIVATNPLAASLCGVSENSMLEKNISDILPYSPLNNVDLENIKATPKRFKFNDRKLYAERSVISVNDKPFAIISHLQDVTDSSPVSAKVSQISSHEMLLEDIIENSYDGIYITDKDGKTVMVNKAYERISGIKRNILLGEYMSTLVSAGLLSTSLTEEVVSTKKTITRTQRNRNNVEVMITGSPIFDDDGNVHHVITNVRDITELVALNSKLEAESSRASFYQEQLLRASSDENIVCRSEEFENVLSMAGKVSKMDSTVLVLGETGVGKEIVSQYIHKHSTRSSKPYITINCGAIPATLLESELFGYVGGAFTGASPKGKPGRFELADTGTLFLDEIGELPLNLQATLLRVLQDGEVTRIGDSKSRKVDVRIIAATNRDLEEMIAEGTFRSDLYYRLNVVSLNIPPLRERKSDIPFLAERTIQELNEKYSATKTLSANFIQALLDHDWPGNIRELKNFIEKQFVLSDSDVIDSIHSLDHGNVLTVSELEEKEAAPEKLPTYAEAKEQMERDLFTKALEEGKSTYKAASLLEMSQSTFFRKYKELFPEGIK